jgi:hypothetical protein
MTYSEASFYKIYKIKDTEIRQTIQLSLYKYHTFLTSVPDGGDWSASHGSHFASKEKPWYPCITGRVAYLDTAQKIKTFPLLEIKPQSDFIQLCTFIYSIFVTL